MAREQDRLYIAKGDRTMYDRLEAEWILGGRTKKEQFLLALAVGFKHDSRRPFDQREEFFFRKDLRREDEAILDAIAVATAGGSLDVLAEPAQVLIIAQEYAHGGIRILADEFEAAPFGTYSKKFETELVSLGEQLAAGSNATN